jgi:hypothetical protein
VFYEAEAKLLRGPLGHLDFGLATGKVDDPASLGSAVLGAPPHQLHVPEPC